MKAQRRKFQGKVVATVVTLLVASGVGTGIYAKGHRRNGGAGQETEASRELRLKQAEERKAMRQFEVLPESRPSKRDRRELNRLRGRA